jgi:hypothetical protein
VLLAPEEVPPVKAVFEQLRAGPFPNTFENYWLTRNGERRLIEQQWPGMLGLVLLLDEDGKHLHIKASVSLPHDYVQSIEGPVHCGVTMPMVRLQGPCLSMST